MKRVGLLLPFALILAGCGGDDVLPGPPDFTGNPDFSMQPPPPDLTVIGPGPDFTGLILDFTVLPDFTVVLPPMPDIFVPPADLTGICGVPGAPCCMGGVCNGGGCCENALCVGPGNACFGGGICAAGQCQMNCGAAGGACCMGNT